MLLDLIMPKLQGFDVLQALKADPSTAGIPVIVLSNLGQDSDIQLARERGAVDYIIKSNIALEALVERVKTFFASAA
jgi:CheY-like chemotaxis protein